jgi:eukaryotic-like serine/threonine-protein kinase
MAIAPGTRLGPYEITTLIGAGAMGEVYRARDARLARDVAIKVLPPSFAADAERLQRFETEARAAGALNHPNIVAVYDTGVADGVPYVVEELLDGETLRQVLARGPLSARRVLEYATQVAKGLAAANDRGIVHRDLKPENLFVTRDGRAKILDFGLAKIRATASASGSGDSLTEGVTATGMLLGTAGYMSPEQARGEPADHRSDLFALGVVMHEMLGGAKPFSRGSAVDTLHAILHSDPPELSGVPPALARMVSRCLEKEPTRRFQSAHDLAFALEALSDPSGVTPAPAAAVPARRSAPLGRILAGVAIVAAVALGWFAGSGRAPQAPRFTRLTFRTGNIGSARFLADGKSAVFDAQWDGAPPEVFQVPFDFPAARPLGLEMRGVMAVSPSNELALLRGKPPAPYFRDGGMLERMTLSGGSPRAIVDSVLTGDFSPDGSALALVRFSATHILLEYPQGHVLLSSDHDLSFPRVSPDGKSIACVENPVPYDDRGRVVLVGHDGKVRRLTQDFESVSGLAWSADGKEIWFTAANAGIHRSLWSVRPGRPARERLSAPTGLVVMDIAKNGDALLARESIRNTARARMAGDSTARDLSWFDYSVVDDLSPDGKVLLFDEESESAGHLYAACMRRAEDTAPVRLGDGIPVALSPDGAWVFSLVPTTPQKAILLPTGPGQPRVLDLGPLSSVIASASWMPDGQHVLVSGNEAGKQGRLWLLDAAGGPPKAASPGGITFGGRANRRVAPDGRRVLCGSNELPVGLFDLQDQSMKPVPGVTADLRFIGWSADGAGLLAYVRAANPSPVYLVDPATGTRRKLFEIGRAPWEDISSVRVAADLKSYAYTTNSLLHDLYLMRGLR